MKKKRKLKKNVYVVAVILIFVGLLTFSGIKIYKDYKYKQTYEYKLLEHGYELKEVKKLEKTFKDKDLDWLLTIPKNKTILKLVDEKYFLAKNTKEYLDYYEDNDDISLDMVITKINTHTNYDFYNHDIDVDTSLKYLINCNKFYHLAKDYDPGEIVTIPTTYAFGTQKIEKTTYEAYLNMWQAAKEENIHLMVNSSYRSYEEQEEIYNNYKSSYGEDYANKYAAKPGYSEHQTGLALDIFSLDNTSTKTFVNSAAFTWLTNNAYKYGFILRYPLDKENITGYSFESWHYRYVGKDVAKYIQENNITYDEYYAYFIEK